MSAIPALYPNQVPRVNVIAGVPVREDILLTDHKGVEKARLRKDAEKALDQLQSVLPRLLEPQEAVLFVAQAIAPLSTVEQLTLGWYAYALHSVVLVLTNKRLLRMRVRGKSFGKGWTWTRGVMAARWDDLASAKVKGWLSHTLLFEYRNNKKERYWRVNGKAAKKLKALLPALVPAGAGQPTEAQGMVSLCPDCLQVLQPRVYQCAHCGLVFKNETTLLWRNYLLPGGGYIYAGWGVLGFLHAIVDLALIVEMISFALYALRILPPPPPDPGQAPITPDGAAIAFAVVFVLFLLENTVAWLHNRRLIREFVPVR